MKPQIVPKNLNQFCMLYVSGTPAVFKIYCWHYMCCTSLLDGVVLWSTHDIDYLRFNVHRIALDGGLCQSSPVLLHGYVWHKFLHVLLLTWEKPDKMDAEGTHREVHGPLKVKMTMLTMLIMPTLTCHLSTQQICYTRSDWFWVLTNAHMVRCITLVTSTDFHEIFG